MFNCSFPKFSYDWFKLFIRQVISLFHSDFFMVYFLVLSCETCPFVFSFCLPFSLKLSEAVTYAGRESMSFWGSSSVQSVCPVAWRQSFPCVQWPSPPCWRWTLAQGGEAGALRTPGSSQVWWQSPPWSGTLLGCEVLQLHFPGGAGGKEPAYQTQQIRDAVSIPGSGRSGEGHGNPL